jgi:hypothetical protein
VAAFDVKVKDAKGDEFTLHVEGVKTLAEAQAHAEEISGANLDEPKVVDPPFVPEWQRSTIPETNETE